MKRTTRTTNRFLQMLCQGLLAFALTCPAWALISIDANYTFNNGPESGLETFFKSGSDAPVYADGKVTLPSNTYLMGTNLFSLPADNFGIEVIVEQLSNTFDSRWVLDTRPGYQVFLNGNFAWSALDDAYGVGNWSSAFPVSTGTQYRLAIVVDNGTASFYRDGVKIGDRPNLTGLPVLVMTNLMIGAANRAELTGTGTAPPSIRVDEVRLFHFGVGQFNPATDLLTAPTLSGVHVTNPEAGESFVVGASIPARVSINYGTAPYSVSFYLSFEGGAYNYVGAAFSPPYQIDLGSLPAGNYAIYATASDTFAAQYSSPTNMFSVLAPAIVVDKHYTFNQGPEAGLDTFYKSGSEAPVYAGGQVRLGPNTYLRGTNVYSRAPVNFGVEMIVSQTSDCIATGRWVLDTATPFGSGFQFSLLGQVAWEAREDSIGAHWGTASGVSTGIPYRLAIVTMGNANGTITEVFYRNGSVVTSRTDTAGNFVSATQNSLWLGAANRGELTGISATPCAIAVDEVRLFHFDTGLFSPDLLLTNATPLPLTANFSAAPTNGPAPLTVNFVDMTTPGETGIINSRVWDFGDGVTIPAATTNVQHLYTNAGTYSVTLVVSDNAGGVSTNTRTNYIVVDPAVPPTASFLADPIEGDLPLTVNFLDTSTQGSSGAISFRSWDFGDGGTSATFGTNVQHVYTNAGLFDVKLVVNDAALSSTNLQLGLVRVWAPASSYREAVLRSGPVAYYEMNETNGFIAADSVGSLDATYAFGTLHGQSNNDLWSLGLGASLTTVAGSGLLAVPGSPSIQTTGPFTLEFWYKQTQVSGFSRNQLFSPSQYGGGGEFFECYVNSDGSINFNGTSTGPGVSSFDTWHHLVVTRDVGTNALWYLDGTVRASQANDDYLPTAGFSMIFGGGGSENRSFEGTLDEVAFYTNVLSPTIIAAHYAAASNAVAVTANFSASPTLGTPPLDVTFMDLSTGAPVVSRFWDFGDGNTLTTTNTSVEHSYLAPNTTYTVKLVVSGPINVSTNTQVDLIVVSPHSPPTAIFVASPTNGTSPLAVTFTDSSTPGSSGPITSRLWDFGDGSTLLALTNVVNHTYTNGGIFDVSLSVFDAFTSNTLTRLGLIRVQPPAASYREAVLADGPVAYYEMNETSGGIAFDSMGTRNAAYASNAVLAQVNTQFPSLGTGARHTTSSGPGLLSIPNDARLQTEGPFSLELWYRQTQSVATNRNQIFRPSGTGVGGSFFESYVNEFGSVYCNGTATLIGISSFGSWHHLVVTRDVNSNELWYLDGTVVATRTNDNTLLTSAFTFSFGGGGQGGSPFEGTLDEIAVYTKVLSPARIAAHRVAASLDQLVTANFSAEPSVGAAPLQVTFTDTSTGYPVLNRHWNFGDGNSLDTTNTTVLHTYTVAGSTNTVQLIVSGPNNISTNTQIGLILVTSPVPPTPVIADGAVFSVGGIYRFQFATSEGFKYGLEFKDALTNLVWLPVIDEPDFPSPDGWSLVSTGGTMTITDTSGASQPVRYYRLRAGSQ